ncbi:MAG TPA: MBL fold metallo-hydrolase [Chlamydiales bacterium]|nr:MBL fold metallo-hydrolase [Chlamydiales bacterium]
MKNIKQQPFCKCSKKNEKFTNPYLKDLKRSFKDVILWKTGYWKKTNPCKHPPKDFVYPKDEKNLIESDSKARWLGHSSFLIQYKDVAVLTDPIWSKRCSPVQFAGPKRKIHPPIEIDKLPEIHYVMISHNHYDHLDKYTVLKLHKRFPNICWIVSKEVKKWFTKLGIKNVQELNWWEDYTENNQGMTVRFTAVPTQHFSGRSLLDLNKTLWCGFMMEIDEKKIYFAGDTGYNPYQFKEIGQHFKKIDLSLIPIGAYIPREFMKTVHIGPQEAVKVHQDVNSSFSIGMHWNTFRLSDEPRSLPPYDLYLSMKKADLDPKKFIAINIGEQVYF